ncbi:MAG: redox-regulated ATPase YchF [Actinobacteria bacterium]|nr:redox-regulated ATPase YchF [Actinomycetota bacterium]
MKLGIIGLPNVGKSTLFNAITAANAEVSNYPFCTVQPNIATVPVPDRRLEELARIVNPEKVIPSTIEFVDIAGLVKGASKGEGLGNRFLSHIREVDAIIHVVRCFKDENVSHVYSDIDPVRDVEVVNLELILADLESLEKRIDKAHRMAKSGEKKYVTEYELLRRVKEELLKGIPLRNMEFSGEERIIIGELFLLSGKPVIYAANVDETDLGKNIEDLTDVKKLWQYASKEKSEVMIVSAKIEEEIMQLDPRERELFMKELGIPLSGMDRLIKACYRLLGLVSFLTIKLPEVRAWTIKKGTRAPEAAGKIHTDFQKGFICVEVIDYNTLVDVGSYTAAKEKGLVRREGKDYIMKDGDVALFKFNV